MVGIRTPGSVPPSCRVSQKGGTLPGWLFLWKIWWFDGRGWGVSAALDAWEERLRLMVSDGKECASALRWTPEGKG